MTRDLQRSPKSSSKEAVGAVPSEEHPERASAPQLCNGVNLLYPYAEPKVKTESQLKLNESSFALFFDVKIALRNKNGRLRYRRNSDNRMINMQTGDIFCDVPTLPDIRSQGVYIDNARAACGNDIFVETILKTVTYPRGAFTPFGGVQISCGGLYTGRYTGNESAVLRVYVGSTAAITADLFGPFTLWFVEGCVFNVDEEGAQRYEMVLYHDVAVKTFSGTLAENTATGSLIIRVSGTKFDVGTFECDTFRVEQFR
jgi:hypothetical protein